MDWRAFATTWVVLLAAAVPGLSAGSTAAAAEIGPDQDFCAEVRRLPAGEDLVLRPGTYAGPCAIRRGGTAERPLVIRAADPANRPRIVYGGRTANVIEIRASHVIVRGLAIGHTQDSVDGVRVYGGRGITVEDCEFEDLGGIAVVANHASVEGLTVRGNVIRSTNATGMYFGCQDGTTCVVSDLLVEGNLIRGVRAPDPQIGYGVELKLNTVGVVRDNVIVDTKGPSIMVYGARDPGRASLVERNVVMGSRRSSGIVVGGGPALVRNNVAVGHAEGGIGLEDYGGRGLLTGVVVAYNTVSDNRLGGIVAPARGVRDALLVGNAVLPRADTPALPAAQPAIRALGNVDCRQLACFAAPADLDFSPGSALAGEAPRGGEAAVPPDDLLGVRRGPRPTVGALERAAGPLPLSRRR